MEKRSRHFIVPLLLIFTLLAPALQAKDRGQEAYNEGHYKKALKIWSKDIAKYERRHKAAKCPYYTNAGAVAYRLGKTDLARKYLEAAKYTVSKNATTFDLLAKIYRKIDNLSLEIDALEHYVKEYPNGKDIDPYTKRLFVTYVESENWEKGLKLWPRISGEVHDSLSYQLGLLKIYVGLKDDAKALPLARKVLKKDQKNVTALQFLAKHYFWKAEHAYQAENKAYAKNRTRSQYAHLLKAYKVITVEFKKSLDYFRDLYQLKPTSRNATYLGDIYARLSDKAKAAHYHNLAKKLKK